MPYYVHKRDEPPESGTPFNTRQAAHGNKTDGEVVTFTPSEDESERWRDREVERFRTGDYLAVPWRLAPWYMHGGRWNGNSVWVPPLVELHHAHLSITAPGLIAYTPSEEHGYQDRQVKVRPGKYLTEYAKTLSKAEIDAYCDQCRAVDKRSTFYLATTPADVDRVYRCCEDSCMCLKNHDFRYGSPVRAYADSDVAVAYLTDDGTEHGTVIARCVVWPEKKIHTTRQYADDSSIGAQLRVALAHAGYTGGHLNGAKIRAIVVDRSTDRYLMPYVDGASYARLSGRYFVLNGDGGCDAKLTSGYVDLYGEDSDDRDDEPEVFYCERDGCHNERDEDESYCQGCENDRYTCSHCRETCFDESIEIDHYGVVCESCENDLRRTCDVADCGETFYQEQFTRTETADRRAHGVTALCPDCADQFTHCDYCDGYTLRDSARCVECDHAMRDDATIALPLDSASDEVPPCTHSS